MTINELIKELIGLRKQWGNIPVRYWIIDHHSSFDGAFYEVMEASGCVNLMIEVTVGLLEFFEPYFKNMEEDDTTN